MNNEIENYQKLRKEAYAYARYHNTDHDTAEDFASFVIVERAKGITKWFRYQFRDFFEKETADLRTDKGQAKHQATHVREDFDEETETGFQLLDLNALIAIEEFIETNGGKNVKQEKLAAEQVTVFAPTFGELAKWLGGTMEAVKKAEAK